MAQDGIFGDGYDIGMLAEWLRSALETSGKSQSDLSRHLTAVLGRSIDRAAVNKMVLDKRQMAADELLAVARYLAVPPPPSFKRMVKLRGYVGAGQEVYQFEDADAGEVEAPPDVVDETEAVEVRGPSMLPLYEDGTLLYYSKQLPPEMMIGKRCIARLEDDRVLVKGLQRGSQPGLYTLVSLNAPDIEDVAVQWAAPIDWIKPR